MMNALQFTGAIEMGLIYALVAMGTVLTFRIIDFPDLTTDGSFTLGVATVGCLLQQGVAWPIACIMAMLAGGLSGLLTGWLAVRWQITNLLAGILVMIGLYSINMRIMQGPNIALCNAETLYTQWALPSLLVTCIVVGLAGVGLVALLYSRLGLKMRATGINPLLGQAYGACPGRITLLTLALSNALVALAGALFVQQLGFADISAGQGTVIIGLAAVIIGECLTARCGLYGSVLGAAVGSMVYRLAIAMALNAKSLGLHTADIQFATALLVALTLIVPKLKALRASPA